MSLNLRHDTVKCQRNSDQGYMLHGSSIHHAVLLFNKFGNWQIDRINTTNGINGDQIDNGLIYPELDLLRSIISDIINPN